MVSHATPRIELGRRALLRAAALGALAGCRGGQRPDDDPRIVFAHQPLWGDRGPFEATLAAFERAHPGTEVVSQTLPNASDVAHQVFLTALEGGSTDFDLLVADVVWVAELARAGWIADLSDALPPQRVRAEMLEAAAASVIVGGRTWAVPWYVDVGLLYRRTDLAPEHPRTFDELEAAVHAARAQDPATLGYVWQGRQYEGLVCNAYEAIWGHGGATFHGGGPIGPEGGGAGARLALDTPEARAGLGRLRGYVERGASPRAVTTMAEEDCRRAFEDGRAVFMRNWPYARAEAERAGSRIRGRVAVGPLPSLDGAGAPGTLGGYHLAVNAHVPPARKERAIALALHLAGHEAGLSLAVSYARNPALRSVYDDRRLAADAPLVASMGPHLERARPRPVTPYYPMLTDTLQVEMSAIVAGLRAPAEALGRAQAAADHLMGLGR